MNGFKKFIQKKGVLEVSIIVLVLLIAGSILLVKQLTREVGGYVTVNINGVEVERHSLSVNGEYVINEGTNILVIEDGYAYMKEAKCPDELCVKQGKIKYTGQTITCLPNRVTIRVEGGTGGIDFVS